MVQKMILSSYKLSDSMVGCNSNRSSFCEELPINNQSNINYNKTEKACMQGLFVYMVPVNDTSSNNVATVQIKVDYLSEDKACHGFLNSDYML